MNRAQAGIIATLLEVATDGNWPRVSAEMISEERGYSPSEIVDAWSALEKEAGVHGTAPAISDFR